MESLEYESRQNRIVRICYAFIDTFDALRTSTEDYADALMSTEETEVLSAQ